MVYIRLWGGFGNQLFQYAFGYSMAKRHNTELFVDCGFFSDEYLSKNARFTKQKPFILNNNLNCIVGNLEGNLKKKIDFIQDKNINRLIRLPNHFSIDIGEGVRYVKETRNLFDDYFMRTYDCDVYYDGYWQCERYFADFKEELVPQLMPVLDTSKYTDILNKIFDENSVAIHIRRGDYSNSKFNLGNLYLLPMNYYDKAIEEISRQIVNPRFYFFSNDIEYVKNYFGDRDDFFYLSGTDGINTIDEFYMMSCCKHQIIANSTFSWWAAWLNKNVNKCVYSPSGWFGNKDIIPRSWEKINYDLERKK
ncbi:MAG: alpha-1,2-fucosyltransferase [Clostridia bacterium]|nr:alpha-1,2-fucosyltransferase [Clostridia bacterium]